MHLLATFTAADVDAWQALILHVLEDIGVVGVAVIALWAKLDSQANKVRLDAQHDTQQAQQKQLSDVQMAMPTTPAPATPAATVLPTKLNVNHDVLTTMLAPTINAAVATTVGPAVKDAVTAAIKALPKWPPASETIPPKAAQ